MIDILCSCKSSHPPKKKRNRQVNLHNKIYKLTGRLAGIIRDLTIFFLSVDFIQFIKILWEIYGIDRSLYFILQFDKK